jgi:hypothetical protein
MILRLFRFLAVTFEVRTGKNPSPIGMKFEAYIQTHQQARVKPKEDNTTQNKIEQIIHFLLGSPA